MPRTVGSRSNAAEQLAGLYSRMMLVRRCEEALIGLFADGEVPGFIHLGIGQEAVPVGIGHVLNPSDTIASTHRGHGHALAKGMPVDGFFAELLGSSDGLCKGRGGSMHVADMSIGMLGANGIVGAGLSIALGSALAHKTLKRNAIAVAFFGDGALAEGLVHECMNMASLLQLPLLFVCENNGWSEFSPSDRQIAFTLEKLAAAYAIPHRLVDGNDVEAVVVAAEEIVSKMRSGAGPVVLECMTNRVRGHFEGDAQKYRAQDEVDALPGKDPLRLVAQRLEKSGFDEADLAAIEQSIAESITGAIERARKSSPADFERSRHEVYTEEAA